MTLPFAAYNGDEPFIFVSYAHDDADRVYREIGWLHDQGFNVWYDEGIPAGTDWRGELANAIDQAALVLFFVTPTSVVSENCLKELNFALDRRCDLIAVHLEATELPVQHQFSLSDRQAILKYELSGSDYRGKLLAGVSERLNTATELLPTEAPGGAMPFWKLLGGVSAAIALVVLFVFGGPWLSNTDLRDGG